MKKSKRLISVFLSAIIAFSFSFQSFAEAGETAGEPYSPFAQIVDNIFGAAHDVIFDFLMKLTNNVCC